jgi:hypothetical protein
MSIVRYGYYFNTSTQSVPMGNNLLHPLQKIHSEHPDFKKMDERYIYNGFVLFERDVPFTSLGRYEEYGTPVPFVQISEPELIEETKPELIEEIKIEDIPVLPEIHLNEGTAKEEIEKIPEVILTPDVIEEMSNKVDIPASTVGEQSDDVSGTQETVVEEKPKKVRKPRTLKIKE